nr:hypothetical protein [uncultured Halomonas sp.]
MIAEVIFAARKRTGAMPDTPAMTGITARTPGVKRAIRILLPPGVAGMDEVWPPP